MALTGRVAFLLLVGVVVVLAWPGGASVTAWTVFVGLLIAVDLRLAVSPRSMRVRRRPPSAVRLTETTLSVITLSNDGERAAHVEVRDAWPPSAGTHRERHRVDIPSGESRAIRTHLTPTRRGERVAGPVTIRSFGPLRLAARQRSVPAPASVRVLPEFRSRVHLPHRLARLREMDGAASVNTRGQGTEFDSLREYQVGDDVRSIDWRATARSENVQVRTWRPERDRRVVIILDCSRWSAGRVGDETRLDAGIEAALLLGALASAGGDRVEVIAFDRAVRARACATAGRADLGRLADSLAPLEPSLVEADWAGIHTTIMRASRQRALVVLLTSTEPALVEEGLAQVIAPLAARHVVMIASVGDLQPTGAPTTLTETYEAAAGARRMLATDATQAWLASTGAHLVAAPPVGLAPAVADAYLHLKAAGRL